jgi:hypothetical protein
VTEVEADIKAKEMFSLETQAGFLRAMIAKFQARDLAKYEPETKNPDGTRKRPEKSNPWSKESRRKRSHDRPSNLPQQQFGDYCVERLMTSLSVAIIIAPTIAARNNLLKYVLYLG